ncbi:MAG: hypothetical protein ACT4QF_09865 [Sporichthyaceae bacterium]
MIRLGSLAGYVFEGPRVLGGWTPPKQSAVFVVLHRPDADGKPQQYGVLYVGHTEDLSAHGLPFEHPRAAAWIDRAGSKWKLYVATLEVIGSVRHREQIVGELCAVYDPPFNDEKYDNAWQNHWIQDYDSPGLTAPLTTPREA